MTDEKTTCPHCDSKHVKYVRSYFDQIDGDEDAYYECQKCHKEFMLYVPR